MIERAGLLVLLLAVALQPSSPACPGYLHASNPEKGQCNLASQKYDSGKWKRRDDNCLLRQESDLPGHAYQFYWDCNRREAKGSDFCTSTPDAEASNCRDRTVEIANWYWEPDSCSLRSFNATVFDRVLAGKHLLIVGDSLGAQQYISMKQLLRPAALPESNFNDFTALALRSGGMLTFKHQIHLIGDDRMRTWDPATDSHVDEVGWAIESKTADYVVFNSGHHWHSVDPKFQNYKQMVRLLLQHFSTQRRGPYFLFRTSNMGHVASEQFSEPLRGPQVLEWGHQYYNQWKQLRDFEHIWPSLIEEYGLQQKVKVLNISFTDARGDAHTNFRLLPQSDAAPVKAPDWLHYCLPGVPDYWNWLVYDAIVSIESKLSELAAI